MARKNNQVRLKDKEANKLGIEINSSKKYRLSDEHKVKLNDLRGVQEIEETTTTKPNDYKEKPLILSAWGSDGQMMDIDSYCDAYGLPRADISSYKLVSHTGTPFYNIVFKEVANEESIDFDKIKEILGNQIGNVYTPKTYKSKRVKESVLKWSDLHFGAYTRNLLNTDDFDKDILLDGLLESINVCNEYGFSKVHVHINGDLIESFSGLNHINSWQSMDSEMIGAKVIRMCSEMLHTAFKEVKNLGTIKIVAGNHDRLSKNNDEDVKGGAADLICYCLELMGYDVEFHPYVISHLVDGINHINLHGDKSISKKSTEKIILDYGVQGIYNLVNEGHLHSVIEKLSIKQRESFEILKDDSILHRRFYLPSFFTGNYYSSTLGFTTNAGYYIIWSNDRNRPQFFNGSV